MKKDYIKYGLFFGGVAGVLEATLGYILHLVPSGVSGAVMYPIFFMISVLAYKASKSLKSIYIMTITASIIKLTNLMLPGLPAIKSINPAIALLFEGLSVALVLKYMMDREEESNFIPILIGSLSWRVLFLINLAIDVRFGVKAPIIQGGLVTMLQYLGYGLINAVIIFGILKLVKGINKNTINFKVKATNWGIVCSIAMAVFVQMMTV